MNKFQHFVAKHRALSKIIVIVFWWLFWFILWCVALDFGKWTAAVCFALCVIFYTIWVDAAAGAVMKPCLDTLNNKCDPYPLLSETEKLLTYKNTENMKRTILINYAVALRDVGEYQRVYDLLKSVNIDKEPLVLNKCAYYNNLFDICTVLGKDEEARIWFEKYMQVYNDMKGKRAKEMLSSSVTAAKAMDAYMRGDYITAVNLINSNVPKNLRGRVESAMDYARACIALGESERAAEALSFIIQNGNKLYCVNEAAAMLRRIRGVEG